MLKSVMDIMPKIGDLRVVRQWGGSYNMSPDRQPILGDTEDCQGFYIACGFSGHGFMLAPMTGLLLSEIILGKKTSMDMNMLHINRFKNMTHIKQEKSVV